MTDLGIRAMTWQEVTDSRTDQLGYWIVPEMISSTSTLLYGESESGKSFIAASLAAALTTGGQFMWRDIIGGPYRVGIGHTDDVGHWEYQDRIMDAVGSSADPGVSFFRIPMMADVRYWDGLLAKLKLSDVNFLILDNMTQAAVGDINKVPAITGFFDGVRRIIAEGIPVVVVSHSSDKNYGNGKSQSPAGSYAIKGAVRWRVFVQRSAGERVKLTFSGNHARTHDITVVHGDGPHFTPHEENTSEDRRERERQRQADTMDEYRAYAEYVISGSSGYGVQLRV